MDNHSPTPARLNTRAATVDLLLIQPGAVRVFRSAVGGERLLMERRAVERLYIGRIAIFG